MSAVSTLGTVQRLRRLEAMGVASYLLRERVGHEPRHGRAERDAVAPAEPLLALCISDVPEVVRAWVGQALATIGMPVSWHVVEDVSKLTVPQDASGYLLLGAELARPVGAQLPAATQASTPIVIADIDLPWLGGALAKRRLWHSLRPLLRQHGTGRS